MDVRGKTMKNNSYHVSPDLLRGKHSPCSTIFLDESTLSEPSVIITVQSLAIAIYYHIKNRDSNRTKDIFEEYLYPSYTEEMDPEEYYHNPDAESIYSFIRPLFNAFRLTGQFAITTLAISRYCENPNLCRVAIKKFSSCGNFTDMQHANAILS
ncbi:cyclin-Y-like protein 1-B [Molossus nigricans]